MSTYPGHHDMGPLRNHVRDLSALLAADAAAWGVVAPENRAAAEKLVAYWLDDRPVRDAAILHLQRERVAVSDACQLITAGRIELKRLAPWGHDVNKLSAARIGVPMWPTVVAFYTGNIESIRAAASLSREDSMRRARAFVEAFARGGFVPTHVLNSFGPWYAQWHLSLCQLRATENLAAAAIAVQLYRMDHGGRLPASLDDLVPNYLPQVPLDSAAATPAPLRYRVADDDGAILWTTGKDGTDEDGKDRPPGISRTDYRVKMDDVVRFRPAVP